MYTSVYYRIIYKMRSSLGFSMCYVRKTNLGKAFDGNVALLGSQSVKWTL